MKIQHETADILLSAFTASTPDLSSLANDYTEKTARGDLAFPEAFVVFAGEVWARFCEAVGEEVVARGIAEDAWDVVAKLNAQLEDALSNTLTCPNCDGDTLVHTGNGQWDCGSCRYQETR